MNGEFNVHEVKMTDNLFHQFDEVSPPMNTVANQFDNYDEKKFQEHF